MIKKNDLLVTLFALAAAALLFAGLWLFQSHEPGSEVAVTVNGKSYGVYPLNKDISVIIEEGNAHNVFVIKDGKAKMIEANCKDKLCVNMKSISKQGETIICLPNRVVLEVKGGQSGLDAIAG